MRMRIVDGKWFQSVDGCKECRKRLNDIKWLLLCLIGIMVFGALILGVVIAAVGCEKQAWLISCLSLFFILITIAYIKVGRPVYVYVLKDKKGQRHTHFHEPQINKWVFIITGMPDLTDAENMIVEGPIYKIQIRGWGRRRHEILNANFGNWQLLDSPRESDGDYPNLTIDNGTVRLTNISIKQADQIIQKLCSPVETLVECDPKETAQLLKTAAANAALIEVVTDVANLIKEWRGANNSKVGMGARVMLETALQCTVHQCAVQYLPDPADTTSAKMASMRDYIYKTVTRLVAQDAKKSPKLREFVAGRPQYLPKDEAVQAGASAAA